MKNSADRGGVLSKEAEGLDLQNSSYPTQPHSVIAKYVLSNCKIAVNIEAEK